MTRTKKLLGFRLNEPVHEWRDRFNRGDGKIINIIPLKHFSPEKYQIVISNGDILTTEFILYPDNWEY